MRPIRLKLTQTASLARLCSTLDKYAKGQLLSWEEATARIRPRRPGRMSLRGQRKAAGKTQAKVARASGLTRAEVSRLEKAESLDDYTVGTVRRYLRALGDDMECVATSRFGHRIVIAPPARQEVVEEDTDT